eukprot:CAMPEP_0197193236 /NCGR_PEP_ID=MMETSP1423-20130617/26753_1 /TAXON_ID=476441 /ORGANISM="Pseudo-nitzschia heimii, Strain UNC1101" /LENGTH=196 /DNA_ID=CAMNT_0042646369 /DNA_START=73 /DNA_END=663 /DNA_ORIENTATION=+
MEASATPEWLQDDDTSPKPTATSLSIDQLGDDKPDESAGKKSKSVFCSFGCVFLNLISLAFFGLFVYSAVVQNNDADGLQWIIFYSVNAAIPALFVVQYTFCSCIPVKLIYLLSVVTAIWSTVYIVISSLNVSNIMGGDATNAAANVNATTNVGDDDNQTLLEAAIFENAGAAIGLFSSLYHPLVAKCCVKTPKKE